MKKIVAFSVVLIVLLIGISAYLLLNLNSIIAEAKPRLEALLEQHVGQPVSIGEISSTLYPDLGLKLKNLKVGSSKSKESGLDLGEFQLLVKLMPLITGNIDVDKLLIDSPKIALKKSDHGIQVIGLENLGKQKKSESTASSPAPGQQPPHTEAKSASDGASFDVALNNFDLSDGLLTIENLLPGGTLKIGDLNLQSRLSLNKGSGVIKELTASTKVNDSLPIRANAKDINFEVNKSFSIESLNIDALDSTSSISGKFDQMAKKGRFDVKVKDLALDKVAKVAKDLAKPDLTLAPQGKVNAGFKFEILPTKAKFRTSGQATISGGSLKVANLDISDLDSALNFEGSALQMDLSAQDTKFKLGPEQLTANFQADKAGELLRLKSLELLGFGGKTNLSAEFGTKNKAFKANVALENLLLQSAFSGLALNKIPLIGTLKDFSANVTGATEPDPMNRLKGYGKLTLIDGELTSDNLAAKVLKNVKDIPFIANSLYEHIPPEFQAELSQKGTLLKNVSGNYTIHDGKLDFSNLSLDSNIFSLLGKGTVGFDSSCDIKARILFSKAFSAAFIQKIRELKALLNERGELEIPLQVKGRPGAIIVIPDVSSLLSQGAKQFIKEKAKDLLKGFSF